MSIQPYGFRVGRKYFANSLTCIITKNIYVAMYIIILCILSFCRLTKMDQIIKHFYADLVKTLPMDDPCFRSMLYSADLLPGNLKDEVKSMPTRADKAEHFLDHGINNDTAKFLKLFEVLKKSDDNSVIRLTEQLRNKINLQAVGSETKGFYFYCKILCLYS